MNMLAIDCCLKLTGVALMTSDIFDSEQYDLGRQQSAELPLMTERIIRRHNLSFSDIDYVALTSGPGYFTGIRVGAAYASGLAYASGAKIIHVSSLEVLAHSFRNDSFRNDRKVLVLVYAGHGFVYASCNGFLDAGEYSHEDILSWLNDNHDAKIISDDPERISMNQIAMQRVKPEMLSLCEFARERINLAVSPINLKISYYRAPQGVN